MADVVALFALLAAVHGGVATASVRPDTAAQAHEAHGTVQTNSFWSQALGVHKHVEVYLPPSYADHPDRRYPVAYYLHGMFGSETDWVKLGHLDATMDSLIAGGMPEMIVVMPDGDDGWYTTWNRLGTYDACLKDTTRKEPATSYCVPWTHYDDYIRRDLVQYVDSTYRTMADRAHRGIAGLSMGGYGAVSLALEYPDVWSAAASHSGVLSPLYLGPHPWNGHPVFAGTNAQLPEAAHGLWSYMQQTFGRDVGGWHARDPLTRVRHVLATQPARMPAIFMDVGQDDPFVDQNRAFDAELTALGVPHVFREWPGTHNWDYWRVHVAQSLVWMAGKIGSPVAGSD